MEHTTTKRQSLWGSTEVAEYLDVPVATLHQWSYRGIGPAHFRVGKHRRYRPEDVDAWLEAQRRGGGAA